LDTFVTKRKWRWKCRGMLLVCFTITLMFSRVFLVFRMFFLLLCHPASSLYRGPAMTALWGWDLVL
jgi:hypothetical protein